MLEATTPHPRSLDLSDHGVLIFLERQPPLIRRVLDIMAQAEPWASDGDFDVIDALTEFGRKLTPEDYRVLGEAPTEDLVQIMSMIGMTRLLMLVDRLGTDGRVDDVEFLARCKEATDDNDEGRRLFGVLFARLMYMTRRQLLHRVYSPRRALRISQALQNISLI